jgi:hypothetical protein
MILAVFDFGRAIYTYSVVANSAREGARYGIVHPSDTSGIITVVQNASMGLEWDKTTVNVSTPVTDTIQVQVSYAFEVITPLVADVLAGGGSLTLESTATMYTGYM